MGPIAVLKLGIATVPVIELFGLRTLRSAPASSPTTPRVRVGIVLSARDYEPGRPTSSVTGSTSATLLGSACRLGNQVTHKVRTLLRSREILVRSWVTWDNHVRGILAASGDAGRILAPTTPSAKKMGPAFLHPLVTPAELLTVPMGF